MIIVIIIIIIIIIIITIQFLLFFMTISEKYPAFCFRLSIKLGNTVLNIFKEYHRILKFHEMSSSVRKKRPKLTAQTVLHSCKTTLLIQGTALSAFFTFVTHFSNKTL